LARSTPFFCASNGADLKRKFIDFSNIEKTPSSFILKTKIKIRLARRFRIYLKGSTMIAIPDTAWIILVVVVIVALAFYLAAIYNNLVAFKNRYQNAFAQIETQLKRRYDLIPNLVETAKGYLKHERETLENVIAARNSALGALQEAKKAANSPQSIAALGTAEGVLQNALGKLSVVVEAYPDLKANQNMIALHEEIVSTENRVSFARQGYNDAVTEFNSYRQSFPQNLLASPFGFTTNAGLLEFADSAAFQEAPKIAF
jgi:LemA protein